MSVCILGSVLSLARCLTTHVYIPSTPTGNQGRKKNKAPRKPRQAKGNGKGKGRAKAGAVGEGGGAMDLLDLTDEPARVVMEDDDVCMSISLCLIGSGLVFVSML